MNEKGLTNNINPGDYRFFICANGSVTDLEEIYSISQPMEGYGKMEGQWRFLAIGKLDGKPLEFFYHTYDQCLTDQRAMAEHLMIYVARRVPDWSRVSKPGVN